MLVEHWNLTQPLPAHDVLFNLIADPDLGTAPLAIARAIAERSPRPVLNAPSASLAAGRMGNRENLTGLPDVRTPRIARLSKRALATLGSAALESRGLTFPLLLRAIGFHNGEHFVKVEGSSDLDATLATLPGDELYAIEFVDCTDAAGRYWKYRAMLVDGIPYPAHLAVSRRWNVHYFSAEMGEEEQASQRRYCDDMAGYLGERAMGALATIAERLGLDYAGIDYTLDDRGDVVVFEANAAMTIYVPDSGNSLASRRAAALRIHDAVRAMVAQRAASRP